MYDCALNTPTVFYKEYSYELLKALREANLIPHKVAYANPTRLRIILHLPCYHVLISVSCNGYLSSLHIRNCILHFSRPTIHFPLHESALVKLIMLLQKLQAHKPPPVLTL